MVIFADESISLNLSLYQNTRYFQLYNRIYSCNKIVTTIFGRGEGESTSSSSKNVKIRSDSQRLARRCDAAISFRSCLRLRKALRALGRERADAEPVFLDPTGKLSRQNPRRRERIRACERVDLANKRTVANGFDGFPICNFPWRARVRKKE